MKPHQVERIAGPLIRPILGSSAVEDIVVLEDYDEGGEPSLLVHVFVAPGILPVGTDMYLRLSRSLSESLDDAGERRFVHLRLRDRKGEEELEGMGSER